MKIAIVGTGNVASQMGKKLTDSGLNIVSVLGRDANKSKELAMSIGCEHWSTIKEGDTKANVYLIAVKDQAIKEVSEQLRNKNAVIIHTSGSTDIKVIDQDLRGVIWPLYSIRKEYDIDWSTVPLITEASCEKSMNVINKICKALGGPTYSLDSKQRAHAHLLAVFINNFSKHLFYLIGNHQSELGIDPTMYQVILNKTLEKIGAEDKDLLSLKKSLTGPARRNDQSIISNHLDLLSEGSPLKELYKTFTTSIINTYYGEEL